MSLIRVVIIVFLLLLGGTGHARAQAETYGDQLTVYLLTMGTGDLVWEKYGHNALWIHDAVRGTDRVYNYGVFDFNSPGYWSRFVQGDWIYQLAVSDIEQTLAAYRYYNRTIVAQELALSGSQKAELAAFLEWNYRPENREYLYDYFRDNCSTRIRDALDRVLDGQLRAATESVPTGTTYRWHSRRLMAESPVVYTGLHAGLGPEADQEISQWEEMFLPEKVRERVLELEVIGEDGTPTPLVRSERVLYEAVGRAPDRQQPPTWTLNFLAIGLLLAAVIVGLARAAPRSAAGRFAFAALGSLWTLLVGVGGLLLAGLWALTNHTASHRNENLFQLDPLALPLIILIPAMVYGATWARRPARLLTMAVAVLSLLGFVLQVLPGLDQVNGEIIALVLPVNLALAWTIASELWTGANGGAAAPITQEAKRHEHSIS